MNALIPKNKKELAGMLSLMDAKSKILGGGTDLVIALRQDPKQMNYLLFAGQLREMQAITLDKEGFIRLGAAVKLSQLAENFHLTGCFSALQDAASDIGSPQIRNLATLGGNIANASPASDLLPNLFLFDAYVKLLSPSGEREVLICDLIEGAGKIRIGCQEIIEEIVLSLERWENYYSAFVKLGYRTRVSVARMGLAIAAKKGTGGVLINPRIWIGAIADKPVRLLEAEKCIHGQKLDEALIEKVSECLRTKLAEVPRRKSTVYKMRATRSIVEDTFTLLTKKMNR